MKTTRKPSALKIFALAVLLLLILAACGENETPPPGETVPPEASLALTQALPTPTLTPEPPRVLNICMAEDPASLFRYDGRNTLAKQSVFAAIYDNPFETDPVSGELLPGLLKNEPTHANQGIALNQVEVSQGHSVMDYNGNVTVLKQGTPLQLGISISLASPSNFEGSTPVILDQYTITYQLTPGLLWSDGQPLTARDVLYSYHLAEALALPADQWALERTELLAAQDDQTLVWTGIPGFTPASAADFFWLPMPSHLLEELPVEETAETEAAALMPVGWGAYRLVEWARGEALRLEENPHYARSEAALPAFDKVNYLVIPELDQALGKLAAGECDVLDKTYRLETLDKAALEDLGQSATLVAEDFEPVMQLVFGIQPASYDAGYNAWTSERQDFFGNPAVRKAVAACVNGEPLAQAIMADRLPESINLPTWPSSSPEDPAQLLADAGWQPNPDDPDGPRVADSTNTDVLPGTVFTVTLLTGQSERDQAAAGLISARLRERCGIEALVQSLASAELYAPGPEGPLFGRNFDLALVNWQTRSGRICELYQANAIPNGSNNWIGTNLAGFADEAYDRECRQYSISLDGSPGCGECLALTNGLPYIPLLPQLKIWAVSHTVDVGLVTEWMMMEYLGPR